LERKVFYRAQVEEGLVLCKHKLSTFSLLIQFMEVHHEKEEFAGCDHRYYGYDHDPVRWLRRQW
jgi:hypothetical protein